MLIWLPFPALRAVYILPGLAWFALIGFAVPAAMVERLVPAVLVRGRRLGLVDYAHALGSLCSARRRRRHRREHVLSALLHRQSDTGSVQACALAEVVLSPLLYLGAAMLYVDQAARLRSRSDAGVHPPLDADASRASRPSSRILSGSGR